MLARMEASEGVDARDLRVVLVVFFRAIRIGSCSIAIFVGAFPDCLSSLSFIVAWVLHCQAPREVCFDGERPAGYQSA